MVQILPAYIKRRDEQGPSFYEMLQLDKALSGAAEGFTKKIIGKQKQEEKRKLEDEEAEGIEKLIGKNVKDIRNPEFRKMFIEHELKRQDLAPQLKKQNRQQELYARKMRGEKLTDDEEAELSIDAQSNAAKIKQKEAEEDKKLRQQQLIAKAASGEELTPQERSELPINAQLALEKSKRPERKRQSDLPIDAEQQKFIDEVRAQPGFDDLDEVGQYRALTKGGVSSKNAETESKLTGEKRNRESKAFDTAYKANEDFINKTTDAYKSYETEMKPRLMQMQRVATNEELMSPTASAFTELLGIPLGSLDNPNNEIYQKLSLDLLKGLPETFGNRIMKIEVENFLKTIPTLLNSPEGRRMITSNFLKLGEMKEVYYNAMRRSQQEALQGNKFPRDFQQSVLDQVKPQIDRINNEFVKMSEITHVPKDTIPFFSPTGQIEFVPKQHAQWASENGGSRIW